MLVFLRLNEQFILKYIYTQRKESMSRHTEQQCEQDNLIFHVHAFVYIYLRDISKYLEIIKNKKHNAYKITS